MKKVYLLLALFLFASVTGFSQKWYGVGNNTPSRIQETLVSSSEDEIIIDVKVGGFFAEKVMTPQGQQMIIGGEDMAAMLTKGAPSLPMYPISMIIGDRAEMEVSIVKSNYTDFENIEVAPSKGNFSRQINPDDVEYVYGEMYQQDAFYPAAQASLEAPYILRDFRGQNVKVYPYAYNPVTKTLRVYTELRIAVKKVSDNGVNQKAVRASKNITLDIESKAAYERRFINFESTSAKYDFLVDEGEMLVVCVDQYMEALQELVDWKNISGRPTTMVGVSETGTTQALKTYIQNYYAEHPNLRYLLLVGENNNLPGMTGVSMTYGAKSDNFFGMLEGDDYYEEVFVGRLSVNSVEDAQHQVSKIIRYERDLDESATWITRAVGIAANEGQGHYGEPDYVHMNYIRDTLLHYTYTEMSQHYNYVNNPTAANMKADFNLGAGIANYCNHGSPDGWAVGDFSNVHVHQLTNDNMLPFIWSVACNNGEFSYDECFAEAWMRAKNPATGEPTGAIGGMFSWIQQPWQPPMYGQDEMVAILAEWRPGYKHTLAGASLNGNMFVLDKCPEDYGDTHNTWILFGDPSMMVRTAAPKSMGVNVPTTLVIGMTELKVQADADFAIATLSKDNQIIASKHVENGEAVLEFEPLANVGDLQLVVIGFNKVTEVIDIEVIPAEGAFVIFDAYDFNQEDGQMDYNETIELSLDVKNVGADPASNVTVKLSTESEYITFVDDTETFASIDGNAIETLEKAFKFHVAPNMPNETKIEFFVECTDGTDVWTTSFKVTGYAPILDLVQVECNDANLLPGETATMTFIFRNIGNSAAYNLLTEVWENAPDITFSETVMTTAEVAAGESFMVSTEVTVAENVEEGSIYEIAYAVSADYNVYSSKFALSVGSILEDFETGDFTAYDWTLPSEQNWYIVSDQVYEGSYSARSGAIAESSSTSLRLQVEVLASGELSFYKKVSTETDYDVFSFLIDNVVVGEWSGTVDWSKSSFEISQGTHVLEWKYAKDYSMSGGSDCCWIDYISFPPVKSVNVLDGVENIEAAVEGQSVTLTWDALSGADEYIIRRDGVEIATQAGTSYTETVANGVYTYNVVARNGNKYSMPAFAVAYVGTVNVAEVETSKVSVYPNPTSGVLNVQIEGKFNATVYNYQGQVVMRNVVNNGQIDMTGLASGIYFVEIRTINSVSVEKVIVK